MDEKELRIIALILERAAHDAEISMLTTLKQSKIFDLCYAYRSRVKPYRKLLEKTSRKIPLKPEYTITDITDIIGLRFVTLFRRDKPEVFAQLIDNILHIGNGPYAFLKGHVEEVIVFETHRRDDVTAEVLRICKDKGIAAPIIKDHAERYSSIHVVTRLTAVVEDEILPATTPKFHIPVEIQIRTVFEDAWGEIDHKYKYVQSREGETLIPISNPEAVKSHLKVLKKFTDGCAEYADTIRAEATDPGVRETDTSKVFSVAPDLLLIEDFRRLGVSEETISKYQEARRTRILAEKEEDLEKGELLHLMAAELFREVAEGGYERSPECSDPANEMVHYYSRMNEALCLMSTNRREYIKAALSMYQSLEGDYSDYLLLRMRLAQAYGKAGQIDRSIREFEQAYQRLTEFTQAGKHFCKQVPEEDYEHMITHLPRLFGYVLWGKARQQDRRDPNGLCSAIASLGRAYHLTQESEAKHGDRAWLHKLNNLAFYAARLVCFLNETDKVDGTLLASLTNWADAKPFLEQRDHYKEQTARHVALLEKQVDVATTDDFDFLDTLAKGYDVLEKWESAYAASERIVDLASVERKDHLGEPGLMADVVLDATILMNRLKHSGKVKGKRS